MNPASLNRLIFLSNWSSLFCTCGQYSREIKTKSNKFTFLFKRMTKAQMKMLMARLTTPMATTRMERLSREKPSEG